jgi:hypothetical protein
MSFPTFLIGFIVFKLIIWLINKPVHKNIINEKKSDRKAIQYLINGRVLDRHHIVYVYDILDFDYNTKVYIESVNEAYYRNLEILKEDEMLGNKVRASINDLKASRNYLLDSCVYLSAVN